MNRTAFACWIWAAGLYFVGVWADHDQFENLRRIERFFGAENVAAVQWGQSVFTSVVPVAFATSAALIAAGVVVQKLTPKTPAPESRSDAELDTTA